MLRVLDLYDHPPADGRVIRVDEFGPLNLQPRKGPSLAAGRPNRLRANARFSGGNFAARPRPTAWLTPAVPFSLSPAEPVVSQTPTSIGGLTVAQ
jgi:hypothetical protein